MSDETRISDVPAPAPPTETEAVPAPEPAPPVAALEPEAAASPPPETPAPPPPETPSPPPPVAGQAAAGPDTAAVAGDRPELIVAGAFAAGFLFAKLLRRRGQ